MLISIDCFVIFIVFFEIIIVFVICKRLFFKMIVFVFLLVVVELWVFIVMLIFVVVSVGVLFILFFIIVIGCWFLGICFKMVNLFWGK